MATGVDRLGGYQDNSPNFDGDLSNQEVFDYRTSTIGPVLYVGDGIS